MSKQESKNSKLGVVTAIGVLCATLLVLYYSVGCNGDCGDGRTTPTDTTDVAISPKWEDAASIDSMSTDSVKQVFRVFWDRSIPMRGYVHSTDPDSQFTLQRIHELLLNSRLAAPDYGHRGISLECMGITSSVDSVACDSRLSHEFFIGDQSRMDRAIENMVSDLNAGNIKGAALITDMMTTTDYGIGASALIPFFRDSTLRGLFNEGVVHVALVGIRIPYWGVQSSACPQSEGSLGCWYHEGRQRYQLLEELAMRPLYVLIMGRSDGDEQRNETPVFQMAAALEESIAHMGDVTSELMTGGALQDSKTQLVWHSLPDSLSYKPVDLILRNGYDCKSDEIVGIRGEFADISLTVDEINADLVADSSKLISDLIWENGSRSFTINLDCTFVRDEGDRKDEEKIFNDEKTVKPSYSTLPVNLNHPVSNVDWDTWSSIEESPNSTLYLTQFIDLGLRPDYYGVTIDPAPPLVCR